MVLDVTHFFTPIPASRKRKLLSADAMRFGVLRRCFRGEGDALAGDGNGKDAVGERAGEPGNVEVGRESKIPAGLTGLALAGKWDAAFHRGKRGHDGQDLAVESQANIRGFATGDQHLYDHAPAV
jgi:hypothetical protein